MTRILPFGVNEFVLDNLIEFDAGQDDPMFQLLFPHRKMLSNRHFDRIKKPQKLGETRLRKEIDRTRQELNPHPSDQYKNIPFYRNQKLQGVQHKYPETLLIFPSAGQTCHAYCTFCFRWAQFTGDKKLIFRVKEITDIIDYIQSNPQITDILLTGGGPMIMRTNILARYIDPILEKTNIKTIRIGSKALTYWPHRFTSDPDADDLLALYERIVRKGKHCAFMAHFNHLAELNPPDTLKAISRIQSTGAVIRTQSPLLRHINDDFQAWIVLWEKQVRLGCVPYYLFVERDTGPKRYFETPISKACRIYQEAFSRISGPARTARGPVMSASSGKVLVDGIVSLHGQKYFALQYLQARNPENCKQPVLAKYSREAVWFDQLELVGNQPKLDLTQHHRIEMYRNGYNQKRAIHD